MKRFFIVFLIVCVFLSGTAMFLYPSIANYFNTKNCSKIIDDYTATVENIDTEEIEKALTAAHEYNEDLFRHMIVLTDPFDPNAFPITDEQYESVLSLSEIMGYLEIPAIDVNLPIYHGTSSEVLAKGVGHLENTSVPVGGESTHTVLSAHCGLPDAILFTNLDKLKEGNIFRINVLTETLVYQIYSIEIVLPDDCKTLYITRGDDVATLLTCTPYGENTHRLLVHGKRVPAEKVEIVEEAEPELEKEMTWEDWLTIATIFLTVVFVILLTIIIARSLKKEQKDE